MKKTFLISILLGLTFLLNAQNNKIYVSRHGGKKQVFKFGKVCYNDTWFTNSSQECDTLICYGSGYALGNIDYGIKRIYKNQKNYYGVFNKSMLITERAIRKSQKECGSLLFTLKKKLVIVQYNNASPSGEANMLIEVVK